MANRTFIQKMLKKLTSQERLDLYELTAVLAENNEQFAQDDYLEMYLSNDRDWKKDYERIKNAGTAKSS